ncbi:MAG: chitosanase [Bacteroidetes bacterium]|nr:chitosanase [Bacteroidota bacterium]
MELTNQQKSICQQVINVFETGSVEGDYSCISIFADGPHKTLQITYGRSQTTEYGNLQELISMYVDAGGTYSDQLQPYISQIGTTPLVDDDDFKKLLKDAGKNDPVMQQVQDDFFEKRYFLPAMTWADNNGFELPLSMLVIYDSYIHSGRIPDFLRQRFTESPPIKGGDEKTWITQYVNTRQDWLATADNPVLHPTVYRTQCFLNEIARDNWDLSLIPVKAHGIDVSG